MKISDMISKRKDLGLFLSHLTRRTESHSAQDNLSSIITSRKIKAKSAFGIAKTKLDNDRLSTNSQYCSCYTDAPIAELKLIHQVSEHRQVKLEPYGVIFQKDYGRANGINPVWYIDNTPGHSWLAEPINSLIDQSINSFEKSEIAKITPFIETFGGANDSDGRYSWKKDFYWEREWRFNGHDFTLPDRIVVFCPEEKIQFFKDLVNDEDKCEIRASVIDICWEPEKIIDELKNSYKNKDITDVSISKDGFENAFGKFAKFPGWWRY